MSMTSQGFPLWAVESDGTPHIVVGWDEHGYPHTVPASVSGLGLADFPDGTWFTFTTTDPTAQAFTAELVSEPGRPATEWSEGDIRVVLRHIADRLDVIGATAPARRIREILESPAEPAPDDLRERLTALADESEANDPIDGAAYARMIRAELAK